MNITVYITVCTKVCITECALQNVHYRMYIAIYTTFTP